MASHFYTIIMWDFITHETYFVYSLGTFLILIGHEKCFCLHLQQQCGKLVQCEFYPPEELGKYAKTLQNATDKSADTTASNVSMIVIADIDFSNFFTKFCPILSLQIKHMSCLCQLCNYIDCLLVSSFTAFTKDREFAGHYIPR